MWGPSGAVPWIKLRARGCKLIPLNCIVEYGIRNPTRNDYLKERKHVTCCRIKLLDSFGGLSFISFVLYNAYAQSCDAFTVSKKYLKTHGWCGTRGMQENL